MSQRPPIAKPPAHPELCQLGFDLAPLVREVRGGFPVLDAWRVAVWLQCQPTLACVTHEGASAVITLHPVLNHPQTPREVIAFILRHELLHLLIAPRVVEGRMLSHPPEFWDAERAQSPESALAWAWLGSVLSGCIRRDGHNECTRVTAAWRKLRHQQRPTMADVAALVTSGAVPEKERAILF